MIRSIKKPFFALILSCLMVFLASPLINNTNAMAGSAEQYFASSSTNAENTFYSVETYSDRIPELQYIISFDAKNLPIRKVLEIIGDKAGLGIAYNPELQRLSSKISLKVEQQTVAYALKKVLSNTEFDATISNTGEILLTRNQTEDSVLKFQQEISGIVIDSETGESMPGVNVLVADTNIGTTTDEEGRYSLDVPSDATSLIFSFIGYVRVEVPIDGRTTIDVEMTQEAATFDEIVVTSFGIEQEKKALGYSVQDISAEELAQTKESNLVSALQGKIAGVNIQNTSGAAGAGVDITIRGISSLSPNSDNQPLFVVDGVPISNQTNTGNVLPSEGTNSPGSSEQFSFSNRASDINPNDIENISILKGPSATALYGLRAANGAVLITTKKGQSGDVQVNFSSSVGISEVNKTPDIQDDYQHGRYGALPFTVFGFEFYQLGPPVNEGTEIFNNFDRLFRNSTTFSNSFSVSGGNESTTYFTSVSNVYEEGIVPNTDWGRTTFKLRGTQKVSDHIDVSGSVSYSNSGGTRPTGGDKSIMSSLSFWTSSNDINDYVFPNGDQKNYSGFRSTPSTGFIDNPRYFAENSTLEDETNRIFGNFGLNYQINNWLAFDYKFGADYYNDSRERFVPPILDVGTQVNGFLTRENINYREINSNAYLRAQQDFSPKLRGSLVLGNQFTDIQLDRVNTRGEGLNVPDFRSLANTTNVFTSEAANNRRLVGIFGDAQLEYDGTYFLSITGRNDWSSTLPEENRSFFYPSVSLSYVFTETLDLADSEIMPFGKLRLSWAQVGKDAPPFSVGEFFQGAPGFPFGGTGGFTRDTQAGSSDLKPEQTTSLEIGTDLRFFENRLQFDLTWYKQNTEDQIVAFPVSNATGLSRFTTNSGEIENTGLELLVKGTPFKQRDFSWDVSVNWSTVESEVISLPEGLDVIEFANAGFSGVTSRIQEGGELGDLFGFTYNYDENGQLLIEDDGFPTINTDELVKVGNAFPDWQGGLTNTINYKTFSLSFLIEVREGGDAYDSGLRNSMRNGILEITGIRDEEVIFQGVTSDGSTNTQPVRLTGEFYRDASRFNRAAEIIVQDASWIRLRNASFSYQLPPSILQNIPINAASFSVTGRNLFVDTPFRGFDPEGQQFSAGSNVYGFTGLNIPTTRSVTFSLNLNF